MEAARSAKRIKDQTASSTHKTTAQGILTWYVMESNPPAFLSHFKSFVSDSSIATRTVVLDLYSNYKFELFYNLHLGLIEMILRLIDSRLKSVIIVPLRVLHRVTLFLLEIKSFHMRSKLHLDSMVTSRSLCLNS